MNNSAQSKGFLTGSSVGKKKICLPLQEMGFNSWGWEDPLEKGRATHSRILAWRILWTEEPGGLCSMRSQITRHD